MRPHDRPPNDDESKTVADVAKTKTKEPTLEANEAGIGLVRFIHCKLQSLPGIPQLNSHGLTTKR